MEREQLFRYYSYQDLNQRGSVIAEYVWIDGSGLQLRSKAKTITHKVNSLADLPDWNYDGSSCYQASTHNSEVIMKPVAYYPDPFRGGDNIIVMTETFVWADDKFTTLKPANTNFRHYAKAIFDAGKFEEPWFGIEQEYSLLEIKNNFTVKPLGWPSSGFQALRDPTIAQSVPTFATAELSLMLTTRLASSPASKFLELTARSCPASGSIRLAPLSASRLVI